MTTPSISSNANSKALQDIMVDNVGQVQINASGDIEIISQLGEKGEKLAVISNRDLICNQGSLGESYAMNFSSVEDLVDNRKKFYEHNKELIDYYVSLTMMFEDVSRRRQNILVAYTILENENFDNEIMLDIKLYHKQLDIKCQDLFKEITAIQKIAPNIAEYINNRYSKFDLEDLERPYEYAREDKNYRIADKQNLEAVEFSVYSGAGHPFDEIEHAKEYTILHKNHGDPKGPIGVSGDPDPAGSTIMSPYYTSTYVPTYCNTAASIH